MGADSVKWKYKVVRHQVYGDNASLDDFERTLNKLGADGWGLVNVVALNYTFTAFLRRRVEDVHPISRKRRTSSDYVR